MDGLAFFVYFDSQTKICFEEIKTSSKLVEKIGGFVKTRFVKLSDEPTTLEQVLQLLFVYLFLFCQKQI